MTRTTVAAAFLVLAAFLPAQQAAAQNALGGAIGSAIVGGAIGGAVGHGNPGGIIAGAAIGATTARLLRMRPSSATADTSGGIAAATTAIPTAPGSRSV
jgi:hypothetical protein